MPFSSAEMYAESMHCNCRAYAAQTRDRAPLDLFFVQESHDPLTDNQKCRILSKVDCEIPESRKIFTGYLGEFGNSLKQHLPIIILIVVSNNFCTPRFKNVLEKNMLWLTTIAEIIGNNCKYNERCQAVTLASFLGDSLKSQNLIRTSHLPTLVF